MHVCHEAEIGVELRKLRQQNGGGDEESDWTKISFVPDLALLTNNPNANVLPEEEYNREGDSAKALAVAGLEVIVRNMYGVFPLRGKFLNVRSVSVNQLAKNAELKSICIILGLQFDKSYETWDERKELRYGHVMLMTDQDAWLANVDRALTVSGLATSGALSRDAQDYFDTPICARRSQD
jgi:DNA gyrase/topoisomerase IV subunit B